MKSHVNDKATATNLPILIFFLVFLPVRTPTLLIPLDLDIFTKTVFLLKQRKIFYFTLSTPIGFFIFLRFHSSMHISWFHNSYFWTFLFSFFLFSFKEKKIRKEAYRENGGSELGAEELLSARTSCVSCHNWRLHSCYSCRKLLLAPVLLHS